MNLPAPVQELWEVWREIEGKARQSAMVSLMGPAGETRDSLKQLFLHRSGRPGSLRVQDLTGVPAEADAYVVSLDPAFGPTTAQLPVLRKLPGGQVVVVMLGGDPAGYDSRRREVAAALGIRVDQVLAARSVSELRPQLARRLMGQFDELGVPLARQFPFLREEAAEQEMQATAKQNALVGAMPIPGADMPIMAANQVKMVLRLAAIYDQPMSVDRLKEILAVVGGAFAFRTAARQLAKFVPGPGWVVGGAMGYTGTFAMGKAAIEYFRRNAEPPAPARMTKATSSTDSPIIDTQATPVETPEQSS